MSEQERVRVDVERLRARVAASCGWGCSIASDELVALLAVVDAARDYVRCRGKRRGTGWPQLLEALEPFTPAEEEFRAMVDRVPMSGRVFNERMQAEERARRLADLGIEVVDPSVSDAVSSGAGGRSESCARADGPQIPSGPAPPPVDRRLEWWQREQAAATRTIVSLEDRLEQAERERDVARRGLKAVSARLARVPALVEALREADLWWSESMARRVPEVRAALAEWEQA